MILFLFAQGYIIFLNVRLCNKQCKQQHYEDWRIFSWIKIKRFGQNWLCISCGYMYIWTMDIDQSSSVVELLARVAGVLGLIPGPAIYFQCTNMLIPPFILQLMLK